MPLQNLRRPTERQARRPTDLRQRCQLGALELRTAAARLDACQSPADELAARLDLMWSTSQALVDYIASGLGRQAEPNVSLTRLLEPLRQMLGLRTHRNEIGHMIAGRVEGVQSAQQAQDEADAVFNAGRIGGRVSG